MAPKHRNGTEWNNYWTRIGHFVQLLYDESSTEIGDLAKVLSVGAENYC